MKNISILAGATLGLALLVTGCESAYISARVREKAAVYATLKPWEKKYIARGDIAVGFTPEMVYLAIGHASKVKRDVAPGTDVELWTYTNFYPPTDAGHVQYGPYRTESPYQPAKTISGPFTFTTEYGEDESYLTGGPTHTPVGMGRTEQSIATTGGPQGGTMEPADLQSYTLYVLFVEGKVARVGLKRT